MFSARVCLLLLSFAACTSFIAQGMELPRKALDDLVSAVADEFDADDEMSKADTSTHKAATPGQAHASNHHGDLDKAIRNRDFATIRQYITNGESTNNMLLRALSLGASGTVNWLLREMGASPDAETANGTAALVIAANYHEGRPRARMIELLIAYNPVRLNPINPGTGNFLAVDLERMGRTAASERIVNALLARTEARLRTNRESHPS